MPLPDQTPKLPKIPFLVGDAVLILAAWFIADRAPHPLPAETVFAIVGCVGLAALIGVIPFLTDYARRQDEALDDRQRSLQALARTAASAAEQIGIAAQGLQELVELAQKNLQQARQLPDLLQGKIGGLQAAAAQISRGETREKFDRVEAPTGGEDGGEPAPKPVRKPRASKPKPAAEPLSALGPTRATSETVAEPKAAEPTLDLDEPALDTAPADPSESAADALASDGATRLLVTAYIGIGNRLFIRGEGPGLSWEKGVPLQFVSIGKWRWEADGASAPIRFKLYKNDQVECAGLGERDLAPGHQQEVTAIF